MPHYTTFRSAVMRCETCDHDFYVDLLVQPFRCVLCDNIVAAPHLPSYQRMELFDAVKLLPEVGDEEQEVQAYKEIEKALYGLSWYDGSRNQVMACWYVILHSDEKENQVYDLLRYLENALLRHTLNI